MDYITWGLLIFALIVLSVNQIRLNRIKREVDRRKGKK
jgi:hypothetical protein